MPYRRDRLVYDKGKLRVRAALGSFVQLPVWQLRFPRGACTELVLGVEKYFPVLGS